MATVALSGIITPSNVVTATSTTTLTNKTLTSPILTTPALGTPASGVVTNLTGTASININGTVGATTANTGAFTTLSASNSTDATSSTTGSLTVAGGIGVVKNIVIQGTSTAVGYAMGNAANNAATIRLYNNGVDDTVLLPGKSGGGVLVNSFGNAGTVGTFTSTGLAVTGTLSASTTGQVGTTLGVGGATPSASGAGISFPATQSASSDANTLDDYEEGTWTPSIGGTATYTARDGRYTKIGNVVTVWCDITINSLLTGSTTDITGLPFAKGSLVQYPGTTGYFASLAISVVNISPVVHSSTSIKFMTLGAAGATVTDGGAIFGNSTRILFSVTYQAS